MSVIEEALVGLLRADATVAATVSTRIYPVVVPEEATLPALAYQRISGPREHTHDAATDLARPRFQITAVARSYPVAKTLANAARTCLDNYQGTASGVVIDAILVQNEMDVFARALDAAKSTWSVIVDMVVWHHE